MPRVKIYAAQMGDVNQGWVWIGQNNLPHRSVVRIIVHPSCKSIYCETLAIDENFLREYNQSPRIHIDNPNASLVLAQWYRKSLGIDAQTEADIQIVPSNSIYGKTRACLDHPQVIVRLTIVLAWWSVVLGLVGAGLGVAALCKN